MAIKSTFARALLGAAQSGRVEDFLSILDDKSGYMSERNSVELAIKVLYTGRDGLQLTVQSPTQVANGESTKTPPDSIQ